MLTVFAFFKNTVFLLILCATLAMSTAALAFKAISLTAQVATMTASATTAAIAHRKSLASTVARLKAKARLRRVMAAVPLVGIGAAGYFERQDFVEWQEENPEGTFTEYSCEVATISAEVVDEVLQELPEEVRPSRDLVLSYLQECDQT